MSIGPVGMSRQNVSFGARRMPVDPEIAAKAAVNRFKGIRQTDARITLRTLESAEPPIQPLGEYIGFDAKYPNQPSVYA